MNRCFFVIIVLLSSCETIDTSSYLKRKISSNTSNAHIERSGFRMVAKKFDELSGWHTGDISSGFNAFSISCNLFLKRSDDYKISSFAGYIYDWKDICKKTKRLSVFSKKVDRDNNEKVYRDFFEENFVPFLILDNENSQGLFTGYYVPELNGSYNRTVRYKYPLYKKPKDKAVPSRKKINDGALNGKNLELLYVDDKIDLFFLHIQGSGRIRLENGKVISVGYDGQNGYEYHSIGRLLVEEGVFELEEVTAQKIKKWLRNNPDRIIDTLNRNPSYIFFKINHDKNVVGAQGLPLTEEGSLAIDNKFMPYGMPLWLDIKISGDEKYQKLLVSQDTGGAIKGVIRGDIFFGFGKKAEILAGEMRNFGQYYVLLPKNITYRENINIK